MSGSSVCHSSKPHMQDNKPEQPLRDCTGLAKSSTNAEENRQTTIETTTEQSVPLTVCHAKEAGTGRMRSTKAKQPKPAAVPATSTTATVCYKNDLCIENRFMSLLSLVDVAYPPLMCVRCEMMFPTRTDVDTHFRANHSSELRYQCLHPHCERRFKSRGALYYHLSHAHLIHQSPKPDPDPPFLFYIAIPKAGLFASKTGVNTSLAPQSQDPSNAPLHLAKDKSQPHSPDCVSLPSSPASSSSVTALTPDNINRTLCLEPSEAALLPPMPSARSFRSPYSSKLASSFKLSRSNSRAPRGAKKMVLSRKTESLLNSVYPPLQCPSCHQMFKRKTNVIKHLIDAHHGEEPYRCVFPSCIHPKLYATREGLVYHLVRSHNDESK